MAGNRFNRLPMSNDLFTYGGSITNAVEILKLRDDINKTVSAIEREFLKMSHKIDEDDSISVSDQIAWFMNSS
jgi:hypothetical protein|tara:strand:+ start:908 stop:1126 length:219 start_codon:yes stop_codon:yes gene_type:complete